MVGNIYIVFGIQVVKNQFFGVQSLTFENNIQIICVFIVMPRSKVETISKGRSYKKNKPDPESSDSDTQYETMSDDDEEEDDDSSYYPSSSND